MHLLAKLKIGTKLTLLIIPPIIFSLFMMGRDSLRELRIAREAEQFNLSVELIGDTEQLVNELQIERRLSASFLRSKQRQLSPELLRQRKITDREMATFFQRIKRTDYYTTNVRREIGNNYQIVRQLGSLRDRVNLTSVEADTVEFLFNRLLTNPSAIVQAIKYDAPTTELANQIEAYLFLTTAIDIAQLERENLAIFVDRKPDSDNFSEVRVKLLADLAIQEELALRGFSANMSSEISNEYKNFLVSSANQKIQEFRNYTTFTDRLLRDPSQGKDWLSAAEQRIEELRTLAKERDKSIRTLARNASTAALRHFWHNLLFSVGTIFLCSILIAILRRTITQPLTEVTKAAQSLSQGEIPENVTYQGTDELGEVADSFRSLQNTLQTFSQEIEEPNRALQRGDRQVRGNAHLFTGIWRYLVEEINHALDLFALLNEKLSQKVDKQATVSYLGALALEKVSAEELGDRIVEEVIRSLNCNRCEIYLFSDREDELTCQNSNERDNKGIKLSPQKIQFCHKEQKEIIKPLTSAYQSAIAIIIPSPMQVLGLIVVQDVRPLFFDPDDLSWLQSIAQILANAFQRQRSEENSRYQTLHDRLTNLPNRLFLEHELQQ